MMHRIDRNDNYYMDIALNEASFGIENQEGGPFGACVVKDGEIVGVGHNTVVKDNDPTCHGEINAIRDACRRLGTFDLSGCELYTTSYPCPLCMYAMRWANIDNCYYGCTVDDAEDIGFRDREFYEQIIGLETNKFGKLNLKEVNREQCLELFEDYKSMNHTNY